MAKKTEIDFLIEQIEMDNLLIEGNLPETCSGWLKSFYINSSGCTDDIIEIKEIFPEIDNIPDEKIAPHLATAIFKYWCGGERYDRDQHILHRLKTEFTRGGLLPAWRDDPIDEAGPITYYVLKKLGVKVPALSSDDEKIDWFNQSFYGAYNPSEDKDNDTFEPEEVSKEVSIKKETPKKKKRFFGLF
jgi:hypothetical protein